MSDKKTFSDGSSLEWVDRETLRYIEGDCALSIWVDYFSKGLFSAGRVIKVSSMKKWDSKPNGISEVVGKEKTQDIIEKIKEYYHGVEVRVDNAEK